ncbi:MAG: Yip1 family protein [Stackebrandtia sp.]
MSGETEATTEARLERRLRRLMWSYPRSYRRHRGEEMLTTALEEAEPGRAKPSRRQARDLVWGGIRCRHRVRGGGVAVTLAVMAALTCGVAVGCAAAWAAWQPSGSLPDAADTQAIAAEAFPRLEPETVERSDELFAYEIDLRESVEPDPDPDSEVHLMGADDYYPGHVAFRYFSPDEITEEWRDQLRTVEERLCSHGWDVAHAERRDVAYHPDGPEGSEEHAVEHEVTAVRDGLMLEIDANESSGPWIHMNLSRLEPATARPALAVGTILGLWAGWLLAAALSRQVMAGSPLRRSLAMFLGYTAVPFAALPMLRTVIHFGWLFATPRLDGMENPPWTAFTLYLFLPLSLIATLIALAAIVVAVLPRRRTATRPAEAEVATR